MKKDIVIWIALIMLLMVREKNFNQKFIRNYYYFLILINNTRKLSLLQVISTTYHHLHVFDLYVPHIVVYSKTLKFDILWYNNKRREEKETWSLSKPPKSRY